MTINVLNQRKATFFFHSNISHQANNCWSLETKVKRVSHLMRWCDSPTQYVHDPYAIAKHISGTMVQMYREIPNGH